MRRIVYLIVFVALAPGGVASAEPGAGALGRRYAARDTLSVQPEQDAAVKDMLESAVWSPGKFAVTVEPIDATQPPGASAIVRFPAPRPLARGAAGVNTVVIEWYAAQRDAAAGDDAAARPAPAVLCLHILDGRMHVARAFARRFAERGIHGFVMYLPGYGPREDHRYMFSGEYFFELMRMSVADARRARDALAVLPGVDAQRISVQGTSFGAFIGASAAALDGAFEHTFLVLAGGDLHHLFLHGRREVQWIRRSLSLAGVEGEKLRALCRSIDPARLAHRLDAQRTWLFTATADQVVPAHCAKALAEAAGLDEAHHRFIHGDHYTVVIHLPWVAQFFVDTIRGQKSGADL